MRDRESTHPVVFFFLVLPYGISSGFVSITLPFILTRVGFSVALAASIVAIGVSANLWRFLWGPVADLTLTARRWLVSGGKPRRQRHWRWCGSLARGSFLQGNRRRRTRDRHAGLGGRDLLCIRCTDCFDGDPRRTNAHFVARYLIDGARRHSAFHHHARLLAYRRRRNEQFVVGGCA